MQLEDGVLLGEAGPGGVSKRRADVLTVESGLRPIGVEPLGSLLCANIGPQTGRQERDKAASSLDSGPSSCQKSDKDCKLKLGQPADQIDDQTSRAESPFAFCGLASQAAGPGYQQLGQDDTLALPRPCDGSQALALGNSNELALVQEEVAKAQCYQVARDYVMDQQLAQACPSSEGHDEALLEHGSLVRLLPENEPTLETEFGATIGSGCAGGEGGYRRGRRESDLMCLDVFGHCQARQEELEIGQFFPPDEHQSQHQFQSSAQPVPTFEQHERKQHEPFDADRQINHQTQVWPEAEAEMSAEQQHYGQYMPTNQYFYQQPLLTSAHIETGESEQSSNFAGQAQEEGKSSRHLDGQMVASYRQNHEHSCTPLGQYEPQHGTESEQVVCNSSTALNGDQANRHHQTVAYGQQIGQDLNFDAGQNCQGRNFSAPANTETFTIHHRHHQPSAHYQPNAHPHHQEQGHSGRQFCQTNCANTQTEQSQLNQQTFGQHDSQDFREIAHNNQVGFQQIAHTNQDCSCTNSALGLDPSSLVRADYPSADTHAISYTGPVIYYQPPCESLELGCPDRSFRPLANNYPDLQEEPDKTYHLLGQSATLPLDQEQHVASYDQHFAHQHQQSAFPVYSANQEQAANQVGAVVPSVSRLYNPSAAINSCLMDLQEYEDSSDGEVDSPEASSSVNSRNRTKSGAKSSDKSSGCAPETLEKLRECLERKRLVKESLKVKSLALPSQIPSPGHKIDELNRRRLVRSTEQANRGSFPPSRANSLCSISSQSASYSSLDEQAESRDAKTTSIETYRPVCSPAMEGKQLRSRTVPIASSFQPSSSPSCSSPSSSSPSSCSYSDHQASSLICYEGNRTRSKKRRRHNQKPLGLSSCSSTETILD